MSPRQDESNRSKAWFEFKEARSDYESYLADPYTAGSQEDTDCILERLLELADTARRLFDELAAKGMSYYDDVDIEATEA